jgi:hypothetical protein
MAKRFTATEIWSEDWFLEMPNEYKLFWYYMLSRCDHAGVFKPNTKGFQLVINKRIDTAKAIDFFNAEKERIRITDKKNWWIMDFFCFQYGHIFNIRNKLHFSIYSIYNQEGINLRTNRGLKEVKWWTWSGLIEDFDTLKEKEIDNSILVRQTTENGKTKKPIRNFKAQGEELFAERVAGHSIADGS